MELYGERGFDETTVAEIAKRAGLTERTFFRHFADKREVLFSGSELLVSAIVDAVLAAPDSATAFDAVAAGIDAAAEVLTELRDRARQRQRIIDANTELQERELIKMERLSESIAAALCRRGVAEPAASLAAGAGVAAFRTAFATWVHDDNAPDFSRVIAEAVAELRAVTAAVPSAGATA